MRRHLSTLLMVASIVAFVWFCHEHGEQFERLRALRFGHLALLAAIVLSTQMVSSLLLRVFAAHFQYRIPPWDSLLLFSLAQYWNYLPGRMGTLVRAAYVKRRFGFPYSLYAVFMLAPPLLLFIVSSVLGLALCVWAASQGFSVPLAFIAFQAALLVVSLLMSRVRPQRLIEKMGGAESLAAVSEFWRRLWHDLKLVSKLCTLHGVLILMHAVRFSVLCQIVLGEPHFLYSIFFSIFAGMGSLMSLTPGALGVREGFVGLTLSALSFPLADALLIALMDRAVMMMVVFPMGLVSNAVLSRNDAPVPRDGDPKP